MVSSAHRKRLERGDRNDQRIDRVLQTARRPLVAARFGTSTGREATVVGWLRRHETDLGLRVDADVDTRGPLVVAQFIRVQTVGSDHLGAGARATGRRSETSVCNAPKDDGAELPVGRRCKNTLTLKSPTGYARPLALPRNSDVLSWYPCSNWAARQSVPFNVVTSDSCFGSGGSLLKANKHEDRVNAG